MFTDVVSPPSSVSSGGRVPVRQVLCMALEHREGGGDVVRWRERSESRDMRPWPALVSPHIPADLRRWQAPDRRADVVLINWADPDDLFCFEVIGRAVDLGPARPDWPVRCDLGNIILSDKISQSERLPVQLQTAAARRGPFRALRPLWQPGDPGHMGRADQCEDGCADTEWRDDMLIDPHGIDRGVVGVLLLGALARTLSSENSRCQRSTSKSR